MEKSTAPAPNASEASDSEEVSLEDLHVADAEHWVDGPPLEIFKRLRSQCPVHWSEMNDFPGEAGYWGVHKAAHVREVSLDWETYSSEVGGCVGLTHGIPLELMNSMFIGMDPPKHDRIKRLFQRGFTPKRIAEHEDEIRAITEGVLDRVAPRGECDLVLDVAQPVVSRVIGSFMGIPEGEDEAWAALMNTTLGAGDEGTAMSEAPEIAVQALGEVFQRCKAMVEERRENPTDDLTSVLVHAEIEGERLTDEEVVMGFFLLVAAGNDSTKATYTSGMKALMEDPEQMRTLVGEPDLVPAAVEESLRMFPAFAHFRRTTTRETEIGGQPIAAGEKVLMWYVSSNRDEEVYEDPDRFDVRRNPEHQAFGAGGRHFCLGTALARLELRILFEETLKRFPEMRIDGPTPYVLSPFLNQLRSLPVRWQ